MKTPNQNTFCLLLILANAFCVGAASAEWRCETKNFLLNARCQFRTEVACTSSSGQTAAGFIDGSAVPDTVISRIISNTGVQFEHRDLVNSQQLQVNQVSQYAVNTPENRRLYRPWLEEQPNTTYRVASHGRERLVPRGDSVSELWSEGFVFKGDLPKLVKDTRPRWQTWYGMRIDPSGCPDPSATIEVGPGSAKTAGEPAQEQPVGAR